MISQEKIKILAIQFKYLGDAVFLTPALKALKGQFSNIELHVLVASEVAPLLENIPWITKVWAMPRKRGKAKLFQSLPFLSALRKVGFDRCVDFGGNDRSAIVSLLSGAPIRLGPTDKNKPKLLQQICFTQIVSYKNTDVPQIDLHLKLLSKWGIDKHQDLHLEIFCDPAFANEAAEICPPNSIICHIGTSQQKKDWPIKYWGELSHLSRHSGINLIFSAGTNERERNLLVELKKIAPDSTFLAPVNNLNLFLNIIKNSRLVIAGDTGPLHFAAGLGVPILGIFAVGNSISQAAPVYNEEQKICTNHCPCYQEFSDLSYCKLPESCMASIQPEAVFLKLKNILAKSNLN